MQTGWSPNPALCLLTLVKFWAWRWDLQKWFFTLLSLYLLQFQYSLWHLLLLWSRRVVSGVDQGDSGAVTQWGDPLLCENPATRSAVVKLSHHCPMTQDVQNTSLGMLICCTCVVCWAAGLPLQCLVQEWVSLLQHLHSVFLQPLFRSFAASLSKLKAPCHGPAVLQRLSAAHPDQLC